MTMELKTMMISRMMAAYSVSETDTDHSVNKHSSSSAEVKHMTFWLLVKVMIYDNDNKESRRSLLQLALHIGHCQWRLWQWDRQSTKLSLANFKQGMILSFWRLYYCNYLPSFSAAGLMKGTMRLSGESTGEWQLWQDWIWKRQRISRLFPLYLFPFLVFLAWLFNRTCCNKIIIKSPGEGWWWGAYKDYG